MAGRQANWDAVPVGGSGVLDEGYYLTAIESLVEQPTQTGKLMYTGTFRVLEPARNAGMPVFERFVLGTEDDPEAADPDTWGKTVGAKQLRRCLEKAAVPLDRDMDLVCVGAKDKQVVLHLSQETETKEGQYKGRVRNRVRDFYAPGERAVGGTAPANGPAPRRAASAAAAMSRQLAPVDDE